MIKNEIKRLKNIAYFMRILSVSVGLNKMIMVLSWSSGVLSLSTTTIVGRG